MEKTRREFLIGTGKVASVVPALPYLKVVGELKPATPPSSDLQVYLNSIQEEKDRLASIIENYPGNIMSGIKHRNPEQYIQNLEDFNMYFPMYKSGEIQYGIPWALLWIMHAHETTVSRNTNPGASGYKGAMQLSPHHLLKREIIQAVEGWEFLDELPQRYLIRNGWPTNDWEDILRASYLIRWMAQWGDTDQQHENKALEVVGYRYSHQDHGRARVSKYYQLKALFQVVP